MFKPRWLMTPRQREQLDAQYADLLELRRELATMNATQKSLRARELCGGAMELRRDLHLDGGALAACVVAAAVMLAVATTMHSLLVLFATILLPLSALRLLSHYALSRDTYYGALRQIREVDQPPESSRFDD